MSSLIERARPTGPLAALAAQAHPELADADPALLASRCTRLAEEVTQLHERVRFLEQLALEDPVLPILARKAFLREAGRMLRYRARHQLPLTLLYLDVDRFGAITQAFGQDGGEAVLRRACAAITGMLRASDLFGRVGVDGLAALLMRSAPEEVVLKAQQLTVQLNGSPAMHLGRPIAFTVTVSLQDCAGFDGFDGIDAIIETAQAEVLSKRTGISTIETMTSLLGR
jgi:diguanylate cyclase (GGDEF)-like protein